MSPQAHPELAAKFPGGDREALDVIEKNFVVTQGFVIRPRIQGYIPTDREDDAICYLADEWDFDYDQNC